jgi:hypothetical protein
MWRRLLVGCMAAGIVACSATSTVAPARTPPGTATPTRSAGSPGTSSAATGRAGKSAAALAASYYQAVESQDYRRAFAYLAADVTGPDGRRLALAGFLRLAHMFDGQGGPVTGFSADAFGSLVVMTIDRKKYGPYHAHLKLVRDASGWAIISIDRI